MYIWMQICMQCLPAKTMSDPPLSFMCFWSACVWRFPSTTSPSLTLHTYIMGLPARMHSSWCQIHACEHTKIRAFVYQASILSSLFSCHGNIKHQTHKLNFHCSFWMAFRQVHLCTYVYKQKGTHDCVIQTWLCLSTHISFINKISHLLIDTWEHMYV